MAAVLGKAGKSVAIVERNLSERDVIVGELLQPGGVKLLEEMGLEYHFDRPLVGMITRLTYQKGIDLVQLALPAVDFILLITRYSNDQHLRQAGKPDPILAPGIL